MDWKKLIDDLRKAGIKQDEIAANCGCKQSSISDLATGATTLPNYRIADALRDLHRKVMRRQQRKNKAEVD